MKALNSIRFQCWNLSHDLPPVEEHFVSFSEAIVRHSLLLFTCSSQSTHISSETGVTSSVQDFRARREKSILELKQRSCLTSGPSDSKLEQAFLFSVCSNREITPETTAFTECGVDEDSRESLNLRYKKSTTIPISDMATAAPIRTPVSYKRELRF